MWFQKEISLIPQRRGFHLVTQEVLGQLLELQEYGIGTLHLLIKHTSASLSINENADPCVRHDFESFFNQCIRENEPYYQHTMEGSDDLPAHIKASLLGASLTIPITDGRLSLGTWQGIYLCEHRYQGGSRRLMATLNGRKIGYVEKN